MSFESLNPNRKFGDAGPTIHRAFTADGNNISLCADREHRSEVWRFVNRMLDMLVRPEMKFFRWSPSAYTVCGYTGLILGILVGILLALYQGLSLWVMVGLTGTAMLTFLGLVMVTKIITAKEQLIYYHHEIAILIFSAVFLWLTGHSLLSYLDLSILGIGIFLACGRIGCLMVGCCHGKPHKWGACYRPEHAEAGFTHYYVGIRLFPIQAVESLWVTGVVIVGVVFVLQVRPLGETLAWYIMAYDIGRFSFEFVRGDPERPYHLGFSEGQWISIILVAVVLWGESAGIFLFHPWHLAAAAGMVITMVIVAMYRHFRRTDRHRLLNPRHVKEVAEAIGMVPVSDAQPTVIPVCRTSLGIQISTGNIREAGTAVHHYAISRENKTMNEETAGILADLIVKLKQYPGAGALVTQNRGVYHLLLRPLGNRGGDERIGIS